MLHLKLEIPRQRIALVQRPRLIEAMRVLTATRAMLLVAPPGYGKTTVLSQWSDAVGETGAALAWLTLDEDDAEPRQFLTGLILALKGAGIDVGGLGPQAELGLVESSIDTCLRLLVRTLEDYDQPCFLLLDDYHRPSGPALDRLLHNLILALPDNVHLVISARTRPNIGVPQLLAAGLTTELNAESLRLTTEECRQLLDTDIPEADFAMLVDHTEGWPAALQLARMVLRGKQDISHALRTLTNRGSHLSAYLTDQVLGMLSEEVLDFLLETSILERFTAELTDAVRDRNDSWAMMDALEPLQSLITPTEDDDVWYRYHHLFADYLRALLAQRRPADVPRLHSRASVAFEAKGLLIEAVRHAAAAGDFARCAHLIEQAGGWRLVLYGGKSQLATVLRYIPAEELARWPRILIADAYLKLKDGELAASRAALDLVPSLDRIAGLEWAQIDDVTHDALNIATLLDIYEDKVNLASIERNERLRNRVPATEGLTRGVLGCQQAVSAMGVGRLAHAETLARSAMSSMRHAHSVLGYNYCFLHAGLSAMLRGRMRDARSHLTQAREMAEQNFGEDSGLKSLSDILWGTQHFWCSGNTGMTDDAFERAFAHVRHYDGWFEIYAAGLDTRFRLAWARNDTPAMERVIEDGLDLCRERGIRRLELLVRGHRLMLALARGGRSEARHIAHAFMGDLRPGCWKTQPELWRPVLDCGLPMVHLFQESDRSQALLIADDLVDCADCMGAELYRIRALIARAGLLDRMGRHEDALTDLSTAALTAMGEMIRQPFLERPSLAGLLRSLRQQIRQHGEEPGLDGFLAHLPDISNEAATTDDIMGPASMAALLSPREMDVMRELRLGSTNKEIARVLAMTEHTVKFHLRNIFAKLGVDRRAHAAVMMRPARHQPSIRDA